MSIPHDDVIKNELLSLLASSTDGRLHVHKIYKELAKLHPELTEQEKYDRYRNSLSKWANRVQFARLHLVAHGMIYRAGAGPRAAHGEWIITEKGRKRAEHS
jgi:hypothetical protein